MGDEAGRHEGFDLSKARLGDFYPSDEVLAEIRRVTIAAGRVDLQLALILVAIKYAEPLEVLLTWSSSRLHKQVRKELRRLFEEDLLEIAVAAVDAAAIQLDERRVVVHSLWDLNPRDTSFKVDILACLTSQDELDALVRERDRVARYRTRHPRGGCPGPQEVAGLEQIRTDLEASKYTLDRLRFVLASALFAGSPSGAKKVLPLRYADLRIEPGRAGWTGFKAE